MIYLEELLDANRFVKIRELTGKFYNKFFPASPGRLPSVATCLNALML